MKTTATIYYLKRFDPRRNDFLNDLWFELRAADDGVVRIPRERFEEEWVFVSKQETEHPLDLDAIFMRYNVDSVNPLATREGQERLRKVGASHTSMSVGDVVKEKDRLFIVASVGFREVELV